MFLSAEIFFSHFGLQNPGSGTGSGSAIRKNAGSRSAIKQCGSETCAANVAEVLRDVLCNILLGSRDLRRRRLVVSETAPNYHLLAWCSHPLTGAEGGGRWSGSVTVNVWLGDTVYSMRKASSCVLNQASFWIERTNMTFPFLSFRFLSWGSSFRL